MVSLICPKRFNSRDGESPAGGDNVRRLTFGKTAIVYEAEAPCFSLWVLSPNVVIVVARYYGGINLGIGGLIRAYGACARAYLENATLETHIYYHDLQVKVLYPHIGTVVTLCKRLGGQVTNIEGN